MNNSGIGLGLMISRKIARAFGGEIAFKSKSDVGSKFLFSILLGNDEEEEKPLVALNTDSAA